MNEKRRLNRVQWVKNTPVQGAGSAENGPGTWRAPSTENDLIARGILAPGDDPASWGMFPEEDEFPDDAEMPTGKLIPEQEMDASSGYDDFFPDDETEEESEEELESQSQSLNTQSLLIEEDKRPLYNALLILVALYCVCGVAPLFLALFVSLRVFFWLEMVGGVIIVIWLIVGVRPPLMLWIKAKLEAREERKTGQLSGELDEFVR